MYFVLEVFYGSIHFKKREEKSADFQNVEIKHMAIFLTIILTICITLASITI